MSKKKNNNRQRQPTPFKPLPPMGEATAVWAALNLEHAKEVGAFPYAPSDRLDPCLRLIVEDTFHIADLTWATNTFNGSSVCVGPQAADQAWVGSTIGSSGIVSAGNGFDNPAHGWLTTNAQLYRITAICVTVENITQPTDGRDAILLVQHGPAKQVNADSIGDNFDTAEGLPNTEVHMYDASNNPILRFVWVPNRFGTAVDLAGNDHSNDLCWMDPGEISNTWNYSSAISIRTKTPYNASLSANGANKWRFKVWTAIEWLPLSTAPEYGVATTVNIDRFRYESMWLNALKLDSVPSRDDSSTIKSDAITLLRAASKLLGVGYKLASNLTPAKALQLLLSNPATLYEGVKAVGNYFFGPADRAMRWLNRMEPEARAAMNSVLEDMKVDVSEFELRLTALAKREEKVMWQAPKRVRSDTFELVATTHKSVRDQKLQTNQ